MNVYAIYDKATKTYHTPFFAPSDPHAVRSFTQNVRANPQENMVAAVPEDYSLWAIGKYNDETGNLTAMEPVQIVEAHQLKGKS